MPKKKLKRKSAKKVVKRSAKKSKKHSRMASKSKLGKRAKIKKLLAFLKKNKKKKK